MKHKPQLNKRVGTRKTARNEVRKLRQLYASIPERSRSVRRRLKRRTKNEVDSPRSTAL